MRGNALNDRSSLVHSSFTSFRRRKSHSMEIATKLPSVYGSFRRITALLENATRLQAKQVYQIKHGYDLALSLQEATTRLLNDCAGMSAQKRLQKFLSHFTSLLFCPVQAVYHHFVYRL